MVIIDRYRLVFSWEGIRYEGQTAYFMRAFFSGPVLQRMSKVKPDDFIDLDFTKQNMQTGLFLPRHFYIAKLSWKDAVYRQWGIELTGCSLEHEKAGSLKELTDGLKFYIDCSGHEQVVHYKNLVYPAWVVKHSGEELK